MRDSNPKPTDDLSRLWWQLVHRSVVYDECYWQGAGDHCPCRLWHLDAVVGPARWRTERKERKSDEGQAPKPGREQGPRSGRMHWRRDKRRVVALTDELARVRQGRTEEVKALRLELKQARAERNEGIGPALRVAQREAAKLREERDSLRQQGLEKTRKHDRFMDRVDGSVRGKGLYEANRPLKRS